MSSPRAPRMSLRRRSAIGFGVALVLICVAILADVVALARAARAVDAQVSRYDPAAVRVQELLSTLLDQETGVRGYAISGNKQFLDPYHQGILGQAATTAALRKSFAHDPGLLADLDRVTASVDSWRTLTADPLMERVRTHGTGVAAQQSTARFDLVRARMQTLTADVGAARQSARDRLHTDLVVLIVLTIVVALLFVAFVLFTWSGLRRLVIRPVGSLAAQARVVRAGDLQTPVTGGGPKELQQLADDIEAMRQRIVEELLEAQEAGARADANAASLARSNADLEQFAYVASHDLQEPLRKVSNFCQLLERQYSDGLDDRARQYIDFAVDGAKRMQALINDLLAFSRVGRNTDRFTAVDLGAVLTTATDGLSETIAAQQAEVVVDGALPVVRGDSTLLTVLLQNLIGNAVKYRREDVAPRVEITAEPAATSGWWQVSVTDNGIGIEPQYAERIFVIFQRLHLRDQYGGTGIGLSMCKKIVEFHGGTMWLDTHRSPGARLVFTLEQGA